MAKCKCKCCKSARIISDVVSVMNDKCMDVCVNPVYGSPKVLSIMAPLIYDEVGVNLCATLPLGVNISTQYPTAEYATAEIVSVNYTYGAGNVEIEKMQGKPNCYEVTLSNLNVRIQVDLYDCCNRLLGTVPVIATYLPADITAPTYDEDTNPSSVVLGIFAPYGVSNTVTDMTVSPVINYIGYSTTNNFVTQGINMYAIPKVLDFDATDSTITLGISLILQSLYFAGYRVNSAGKIKTPKGSIINPEDTDCLKFVSGKLLDLAIKPLDLGGCGCDKDKNENDGCDNPDLNEGMQNLMNSNFISKDL